MKNIIYFIFFLLVGVCIGFYLFDSLSLRPGGLHLRQSTSPTECDTVTQVRIDTVFRHDTLTVTIPVYSETSAPRAVTLSRNALTHCDSDSVTLRAVTRVYSDSIFHAVISGIDPHLDSLAIIRPIPTVTRSVTTRIPARAVTVSTHSRWGLGLTAGVTATTHGLAPGLTLGLTYRLWP